MQFLNSIQFPVFLSKRLLPRVYTVMSYEVNMHTPQEHEGGKVSLHHLPQVNNFHLLSLNLLTFTVLMLHVCFHTQDEMNSISKCQHKSEVLQ